MWLTNRPRPVQPEESSESWTRSGPRIKLRGPVSPSVPRIFRDVLFLQTHHTCRSIKHVTSLSTCQLSPGLLVSWFLVPGPGFITFPVCSGGDITDELQHQWWSSDGFVKQCWGPNILASWENCSGKQSKTCFWSRISSAERPDLQVL